MNYELTEAAKEDLLAILLHGIEFYGISNAERYRDRLERSFKIISDNPKIARLRTEITPPVRVHPVEMHVIIYMEDDSTGVTILRVRHSSENWPQSPVEAF